MKILELIIEVVTKADKALSDLDKLDRRFDTTAVSASKFDKTLLGIGNTALVVGDNVSLLGARMAKTSAASAVLFLASTAFLGKAAKSASDLEESVNAVNVVFGEGGQQILDFGKNAATSVGLSNAKFNQLSTVTGALLSRAGKPLKEVATLTTDLTVRAADMASVFNTTVDDALSALNQALRGETEAIRRYAGDVTDATLSQFLLEKGITKSLKAFTQQEKILLRYQVIMDQTTKVQGDFARTLDTTANQVRVTRAQYEDMAAAIGRQVLPIKARLLRVVSSILTRFNNLSPATQDLITKFLVFGTALAGVVALLAPVLFVAGRLISLFGKLAQAVGLLRVAASGQKLTKFLSFFRNNPAMIRTLRLISAGFKIIRVVLLAFASTAGLIVAAVIALGLVLEDLWQFMRGGKSVIGQLIGKFKEWRVLERVSDWFKDMGRAAQRALSAIWNSFSETFPKSAAAIERLGRAYWNLTSNVFTLGAEIAGQALDGIVAKFVFWRDAVVELIAQVKAVFADMVDFIMESGVVEVLVSLKEVAGEVGEVVGDGLSKVGSFAGGVFDGAVSGLDDVLSSGVNFLAGPVESAAGATSSVRFGDIIVNPVDPRQGGEGFAEDLVRGLNDRSTNILHATGGSATN